MLRIANLTSSLKSLSPNCTNLPNYCAIRLKSHIRIARHVTLIELHREGLQTKIASDLRFKSQIPITPNRAIWSANTMWIVLMALWGFLVDKHCTTRNVNVHWLLPDFQSASLRCCWIWPSMQCHSRAHIEHAHWCMRSLREFLPVSLRSKFCTWFQSSQCLDSGWLRGQSPDSRVLLHRSTLHPLRISFQLGLRSSWPF